jgi:hypothetical protein
MAGDGSCANCGNPLDPETFIYCPHCGSINAARASEEGIVCDTHLENRAVGFCVICGKGVCDECIENSGNRILCSDPNHRNYLREWKVIHRFDFEYEAAMLYANLEQSDIESEIFSKLNPDAADSASRPTIVEVFVPEKKFEAALEIAKLLGLTGEDTEDEN